MSLSGQKPAPSAMQAMAGRQRAKHNTNVRSASHRKLIAECIWQLGRLIARMAWHQA